MVDRWELGAALHACSVARLPEWITSQTRRKMILQMEVRFSSPDQLLGDWFFSMQQRVSSGRCELC